ncbi:MAG: hypothetical protein JW779_07795 [Candidatus Thorarchaeota archaeon]|nr:hypothetical protein [Candidatus Thorarchaeota archaeon]
MVLRNATGDSSIIRAIAVDDDNLYIASSTGNLAIWKKPEFVSPMIIPGQTSTQIESLLTDGQYLYSGGITGDTTIRIYDRDLVLVHIVRGHAGTIFDMACDNNHLISGSGDATVKIWLKDDWNLEASILAQAHFVLTVALDSSYIYAGGIDNCTNVFNRSSMKRITSLHGHDANILSLDVDDQFVYSGSGELWWGGPGSPRPSSFESAIRVWDKSDWSCVAVLGGHRDNVNAIGNDSRYVYTASDDGTARIYSKSDWSEVTSIDFGVGRVIGLTKDTETIFYACADGNIYHLSLSTL